MRLVVVGADGEADMAVPRGRETDLSWPLGRARFLEVGESPPPPGRLVGVEHGPSAMARGALVRGSLLPPGHVDPPPMAGGPLAYAANGSRIAWSKSSVGSPP